MEFARHLEASATSGELMASSLDKTVRLTKGAEKSCLKKRENAPKRIGINYKMIHTSLMGYEKHSTNKNPHGKKALNTKKKTGTKDA